MEIYREKIGEINDRLNAIEARKKEISERAKAIKAELESCQDDAVISERKTETEKLTAERASLEKEKTGLESDKEELIRKNDEETRQNAMNGIKFKGENQMTIAERREAFFKKCREHKAEYEVRSILATDTPFVTGADGVTGVRTAASSLVDFVDMRDAYGMDNEIVTFDKDDGTGLKFNKYVRGSKITASNNALGTVKLKGVDLALYTEVDIKAWNNPNCDIESEVKKKIAQSYRRTASALVANGLDTDFYGITNAVDTAGSNMFQEAEVTISENTLRDLFLQANGDLDEIPGGNILVLGKKTLADLGKITGANKNHVYKFTPNANNTNIGIIADDGIAATYVLCSSLPANTMLYGKGLGYRLNNYSNITIEYSMEAAFDRNMVAIRGNVTVGGNIQALKAWTKATITTSTGK